MCVCLSVSHDAAVFPLDQPVVRESSSSEEEVEAEASPTVRRRRVRRSTAGSEPEETLQTQHQPEVQNEQPEHLDPRGGAPQQGHVSGTLNKCILLALVVAISMGFGHFYGKDHSSAA